MKNNIPNSHTYKPFLMTLSDTVLFLKSSTEIRDLKTRKLLAKASILHCPFAVEALANNMIQFCNLNKQFKLSVEKMDMLAKFDFMSVMLKKKLDRGSHSIQVFKDFITLRNNYVHPKITRTDLVLEGENNYKGLENEFDFIGIGSSASEWGVSDAKKCVTALVKAIDDLLLNQLGLDMKYMSCMFSDVLSIDGVIGPIVPSATEWSDWLEKELKCKPVFYTDYVLKRWKDC